MPEGIVGADGPGALLARAPLATGRWRMPGDPAAIGDTVDAVVAFCARRMPPGTAASEALDGVRLSLTAALDTRIRHLRDGAPGRPVRVVAAVCPGRVVLRVADRGRPLPGGVTAAPDPREPGPIDAPAEGGRGWFLILRGVDSVTLARRSGWNRLTLERRV